MKLRLLGVMNPRFSEVVFSANSATSVVAQASLRSVLSQQRQYSW